MCGARIGEDGAEEGKTNGSLSKRERETSHSLALLCFGFPLFSVLFVFNKRLGQLAYIYGRARLVCVCVWVG